MVTPITIHSAAENRIATASPFIAVGPALNSSSHSVHSSVGGSFTRIMPPAAIASSAKLRPPASTPCQCIHFSPYLQLLLIRKIGQRKHGFFFTRSFHNWADLILGYYESPLTVHTQQSRTPKAHCARNGPLPLLPSGPGGIGGVSSRKTDVRPVSILPRPFFSFTPAA